MKTINSKRVYLIVGLDNGQPIEVFYQLYDFLNEDNSYELAYSLQDNLDAILDLNIGSSLLMFSNRDAQNDYNKIIVHRRK